MCRLRLIFPARLQASIVSTAKLNFCVRNGNRWTLCVRITDSRTYSARFLPFGLCQHRPIFPARLQASIVGTAKLNFCVRNGNRWTLCVKDTDWWCTFRDSTPRCPIAYPHDQDGNCSRNAFFMHACSLWCTFRDSNPGPTD